MSADNPLDRRAAVRALLAARDDALVIAGLGSPAYDLFAAGDHPRNFYLWGAMGGAAMIGMGLALARPSEPVIVITGDGEMLMGLGALATIAAARPPNLSLVVLDNRRYGETGMQVSHTGLGVDLVGMAREAGFAWALGVREAAALAMVGERLRRREGPGFASIRIAAGETPRVLPPRDGVELKNRLRRELGLTTI
jgi:thiamine pyrophosphate-dependent acetolactate synthase large subunit-like protein